MVVVQPPPVYQQPRFVPQTAVEALDDPFLPRRPLGQSDEEHGRVHGRHAGPVDETRLNQSLILLLKREALAQRINDQAHAAQHANAPAKQMALH